MKKAFLIAPAIALLFSAAGAWADDRPNPIAAIVKKLKEADKNGDGKLSKEEAPGPVKENFDKLDTNQDGLLDADELKQAFQAGIKEAIVKAAKEQFEKADKNGDGKLSEDEVPEQFRPGFKRIDTNDDGFVDKQEAAQALTKIGQIISGAVQKFKEADADGDGKLSKDEAPEQLKPHFDKVDADQDGYVDGREMLTALGELVKRSLTKEGQKE